MKSFSVTVELNSQCDETPLEATKKALARIKESGHTFIYNVKDDETGENFIVDLENETVEIDNDDIDY